MARPAGIAQTQVGSASLYFTPTTAFGALSYESGDFLLVEATQDGNASSALSVSAGWTIVGTQASQSGSRTILAHKIAASSSETCPTFTSASASTVWSGTCQVFKDVDATTPVEGWQRYEWSGTSSVLSSSVTESSNSGSQISISADSLVLYAAGSDAGRSIRFASDECMACGPIYEHDDGAVGAYNNQLLAYRQADASGNPPAISLYPGSNALGGNLWVVALKNASGGSRAPYAKSGIDELAWWGKWSHRLPTRIAPSSIAASIWSYTASASTATESNTANGPAGNFPLRCSSYTIGAAAEWNGVALDYTSSPLDLTDVITSVEWACSRGSASGQIDTKGVILVVTDGTSVQGYQLLAKAYITASQWYASQIAADLATPAFGSGVDLTNVTKAAILVQCTSTSGGVILYVKNLLRIGRAEITGGGAADPATYATPYNCVRWWGLQDVVTMQGDYQVMARGKIRIGDTSKYTYFKASPFSLSFPGARSMVTQKFWDGAANAIGLTVSPSASDTPNMAASIVATGLQQGYELEAGSALSDHSFSGQSAVGCAVVLAPGFDYAGLTLSGGKVTLGAADSYAFSLLDSEVVTFTPTAASTYDLAGVTSAGTMDLRNASATYAITVELASGITYTTANNTGAAITVTLPVVTADISITGMPVTSGAERRLQIINESARTADDWQASTAYFAGDMVLRTTGIGSEATAGLYMRCTTPGTSGASEPTWDTTVGDTTSDGSAVWTTYAVLYYDDDPAAATLSDTYIDGEEFAAGETVTIRFAEMDGADSFSTYDTTVLATADGFSALVIEEADPVYASYALDGSAQDATFSPDYVANYIVLDANLDFSGKAAFAYYCYLLTTSEGMYRFWNGLTALDAGNIRNNVDTISLYFDESAGFVKQTDDVRIFRSDWARPAIDPTTGGSGIEINWRVPVNVVSTGGSALTTEEHNQLMTRPNAATNAAAVRAELSDELAATTELWRRHGLDIAAPLTQTATNITAGTIDLAITGDPDVSVTVTRQP